MTECLFDAAFLLFERLLYPLMLEELTAGRQQVVGEKEDRLRSGADLGAFVVRESFRPLL